MSRNIYKWEFTTGEADIYKYRETGFFVSSDEEIEKKIMEYDGQTYQKFIQPNIKICFHVDDLKIKNTKQSPFGNNKLLKYIEYENPFNKFYD